MVLKCKDWNVGVEITVLLILTWVLPYVIISTIVLQACLLSLPPLRLSNPFVTLSASKAVPPPLTVMLLFMQRKMIVSINVMARLL